MVWWPTKPNISPIRLSLDPRARISSSEWTRRDPEWNDRSLSPPFHPTRVYPSWPSYLTKSDISDFDGRGWGEGLSQRARLAESPPHPKFANREFRPLPALRRAVRGMIHYVTVHAR